MNIQIVDISQELARHSTRRFEDRQTSDIEYFTTHHMASGGDIWGVARYHVAPDNHICPKTGCPGACYHYYIDKDGIIYRVNDESLVVYSSGKVQDYRATSRMHLKKGSSANQHSVSILLQGDFMAQGHKGADEPTEPQIRALINLRNHLLNKHKLPPETFLGHCHVNKLGCPGFIVQDYLESLWDKEASLFLPEPEILIKYIQERFRNIILGPMREPTFKKDILPPGE